MTAALNFDNAASAEALKARAGELRSALQQAGFDLSGSALSFTNGGSSGQRGLADGGASGRPQPQPAFTSHADADAARIQTSASRASAAGGVDIRI